MANILEQIPPKLRSLIKKGSAIVLWIPILTFVLGSVASYSVYQNLHQREQEALRARSKQRFEEMLTQLDLLFSNSVLRTQSYEEYLGSRPRSYGQDSKFISQSLAYTFFQRVSIVQNISAQKAGKGLPKLKVILRIDAPKSELKTAKTKYIDSDVVLKTVQTMLKSNNYQQAALQNFEGKPRVYFLLRSKTERDIFFVFTGPLLKLFEKVDLREGESLEVTDTQAKLSWTLYEDQTRVKISAHAEDELQKPLSAEYQTLTAEGLPQTGLKLNFKFKFREREESLSTSMMAGLMSWLVTLLISYLFLVLIRQNKLVTKLVIEKTHDLEKAHHELQETLLGKSRFLGNISHEIRTPLNLILGMIDLCEEEDVGRKISQYLVSMRTSGNHLLSMIEDLLDLAKTESNEIQIHQKKISLVPFLDEVSRIVGQDCLKKNLHFYSYTAADLPVSANFDPSRLRQILLNLLRNACKYTSEGWVSLKTTVVFKSAAKVTLCFEVEDTGVGIPQDKIGKIFDAFFQIEGSYALSEGGVGLGLAIVKELVRKMGGQLAVESHAKLGSKFRVTIDFDVTEKDTWLETFKPADETRQTVVLVSKDVRWLDALGVLGRHPLIDIINLRPSELAEFAANKKTNAHKWVLVDSKDETYPPEVFNNLQDAANLILVGNKRQLTDAGAAQGFAIIDNAPTLLSEVLVAMGFSSKIRRRKEILTSEAIAPPAPASEHLSLIVADDDLGNQELYKAYFEKTDWKVAYASNGQEALDLYLKAPVDLLLLDVRMPIMDGFEVVEKVREHEVAHAAKATPILLVTADALGGVADKAMGLPQVSFLTKPIKKAQLFESIRTAVKVEPKA